jgi:hypothetical protein
VTSDHASERPEELPVTAEETLDRQALRWWDADQVLTESVRGVEVEGPQVRSSLCISEVFESGLEHALERDEPDERQRRQQDQAERVEHGWRGGGSVPCAYAELATLVVRARR